MKPEEWNEGLNHLDPDLLEEYIAKKGECTRKKKRAKPYWFAAVAAVLGLVILMSAVLPGLQRSVVQGTEPGEIPSPGAIQNPGELHLANLVGSPQYPTMVQKPDEKNFGGDYTAYSAAYRQWTDDQKLQYDQPDNYADSLTGFFKRSIAQFTSTEENQVYSPLNLYMALAMVAETTDGNSRQQLLNLLGLDSIEQLRTQAGHVWNAHYTNDGETTLLLGSSLWLDDAFSFHQNTVDLLADSYYASTFHGDLGTTEMNAQLQTWINAQTGGLLREQAGNLKLTPRTAFALASTVYFSAGWQTEFSETRNTRERFHCKDYDQVTTFMNRSFNGTYYWADHFGAVRLNLSGNNAMWLILPDKGVSLETVISSGEYLEMTLDPMNWENQREMKINLSLPKFDISSQMDLVEGMKEMGVTDVFDSNRSDFSPMTDENGLYIGKIDHVARVAIDEEGVVAAAFTVVTVYGNGASAEQKVINFTLDRPFLFIVSSRDNLPLLAGVVNEP